MTAAARVCVVGAGVAGCAAALAARANGADVAIVEGPYGASAMSTGAWDVAPLEGMDGPWRTGRTVGEAIEAVVRDRPHHPYARRAGTTAAGRRALLAEIAAAHGALFGALGIYRPFDLGSHGVLVATEAGVARRAASAQIAVLDLDEAGTSDEARVVAVAELRGYRAFDAPSIAASLGQDATRRGDARRFLATPLEFFRRRSDATLGPAEVAALLDGDEARRRFAAILRRDVTVEGLSAVLVPPVLGRETDDVPAKLASALGVPMGEALGGPGGPQGLRLHRRIEAALDAAKVVRIEGPAVRVVVRGDGVSVETGSGSVAADRVVLATGSLLGGGLVLSDGELREPLLDLPVGVRGEPLALPSSARGRDPVALLGAELHAGGLGSSAGVRVDASMRVIDRDETPMARVLAAGALLADHDPTRDGTGLGVATLTGWVAGATAARPG
ncbi:MAG: FAD-binding protein [Deltaproteobacteria bacterium]|nr:FAD-binding protein [Deltaproteobacteria bacterium]